MSQHTTNRTFDELASGLASGSISRGKALKLMGAALVGGALGSLGIGEAAADDECKPEGKKCRKDHQCCSRNCVNKACAPCPSGQTSCGTQCCQTGFTCVNGACCPNAQVCDTGTSVTCCTEEQVCPGGTSSACCTGAGGSCPSGTECCSVLGHLCEGGKCCVNAGGHCDQSNPCCSSFHCSDGGNCVRG